jgi:hypothetical protein
LIKIQTMKKVFIFFLLLHSISWSQLSPKSVAGMHQQIIIGDEEYKDLKYGINASFRLVDFPAGSIDFDYARIGNVNPILAQLEDTVASNRTNKQINYYGIQFSPRKWAPINTRNLGVKGVSMYPSFGIGFTNYRTNDPTGASLTKKTRGIGLKASWITNIPFLSIETGIKFLRVPSIEAIGSKKNIFTPFVALKFDSMFDALGLGTSYEGTYLSTSTRTTTSVSDRSIGGVYIERTTTTYTQTVTHVTPYTRVTHDVLYGPSLRYSFASQGYKGATRMPGIGATLRFGLMGFDVCADFGQLGYGSNPNKSYLHDPFPTVNEDGVDKTTNRYAAEGQASLFEAKINVNLSGLIIKLIAKQGTQIQAGNGDEKNPCAFRINGFLGYGYAVLRKPTYIRQGAESEVDAQFIAEPDLWVSSTNDARMSESCSFASYGLQFEMGAISLEFGQYRFNKYKAQLGNGNYASIQYTLPINKIITAYKKIKG